MITLLRLARDRCGLGLGQVVRALGYTNINKGCRLIQSLERGERRDMPLARRLCKLYAVPEAALLEADRLDREAKLAAFEVWVNQPEPPQMVVRLMPAVYVTVALPDGLSDHASLESFACDYSRENRVKVCLMLNRRHRVWTNEHGSITTRTETTPADYPGGPSVCIG